MAQCGFAPAPDVPKAFPGMGCSTSSLMDRASELSQALDLPAVPNWSVEAALTERPSLQGLDGPVTPGAMFQSPRPLLSMLGSFDGASALDHGNFFGTGGNTPRDAPTLNAPPNFRMPNGRRESFSMKTRRRSLTSPVRQTAEELSAKYDVSPACNFESAVLPQSGSGPGVSDGASSSTSAGVMFSEMPSINHDILAGVGPGASFDMDRQHAEVKGEHPESLVGMSAEAMSRAPTTPSTAEPAAMGGGEHGFAVGFHSVSDGMSATSLMPPSQSSEAMMAEVHSSGAGSMSTLGNMMSSDAGMRALGMDSLEMAGPSMGSMSSQDTFVLAQQHHEQQRQFNMAMGRHRALTDMLTPRQEGDMLHQQGLREAPSAADLLLPRRRQQQYGKTVGGKAVGGKGYRDGQEHRMYGRSPRGSIGDAEHLQLVEDAQMQAQMREFASGMREQNERSLRGRRRALPHGFAMQGRMPYPEETDIIPEPPAKTRRIIKAVEGAMMHTHQQPQAAVRPMMPMHPHDDSSAVCLLSSCKFISKRTGACCDFKPTFSKHKRGHLAVICKEGHQWVWCSDCCKCEGRAGRGCNNPAHWFERDSFDTGRRNHMNRHTVRK